MRIFVYLRLSGCWVCLELRGKERGLFLVGECVCYGGGCFVVCFTFFFECRGLRVFG